MLANVNTVNSSEALSKSNHSTISRTDVNFSRSRFSSPDVSLRFPLARAVPR
ncbi:hypothetical protein KIN20_023055 [Parelaphostrongylus tenuis]|uniref:Uncharacterized protein n=1 Tax=Parelaphostrongylus tenuis TaxID=148309 RepID=A0AAD5MV05_PARTN|nr:hypothetical protein KIN20_023055 [Parelaphostrongylus tenuis]